MVNFKNLIEIINDSVSLANSTLLSSHSEFIDSYFNTSDNGELTAKTVAMNYPVKMEDNTVKNISVNIPIITLIPIQQPKIDEVKLTANLEVVLDKDDLLVSFSNKEENNSLFGKKKKSSTAKLEIILKPGENTEGLKNVIEGYEKVLRAQIPG